jgi:hypothetical protein
VIAGFLRSYNDLLPDAERDELYAYAALVVGTAAPRSVRRRRARRVLAWGDGPRPRRRRVIVRLRPWDFVLLPAVQAALRMDPEPRREAVRALLDELCAMGRGARGGAQPLVVAAAAAPSAGEGTDGTGDRPVPIATSSATSD